MASADIGLAGSGIDGLAGKLLGHRVGDVDCMGERFLVIREPVEQTLADDGDDDLDDIVLVQLRAERGADLLDGADDEDVAPGRPDGDALGVVSVPIVIRPCVPGARRRSPR